MQGDFQHVTALEQMYEKLKGRKRSDRILPSPSQDVDEDEVEEEIEDDEDEAAEAMEVDQPTSTKQEPIIDEDGFQLVQKGRRKGR